MLIVLPPSETKAEPPRRGRAVDVGGLSFPVLGAAREAVLDALTRTSARADALDLLGAPPGAAAEVERNLGLRAVPARPTLETYTGVLYDALGFATLSPQARRRASSRLVVVSALWGALRPRDAVPAYRLSAGARLDGLPEGVTLEAVWRQVLPGVLDEAAGARGVVVDLRSAGYLAFGRPVAAAGRTVQVRVVRDGPTGRTVVSHLAKHTRGLVARHLLETGADPRTPDALTAALADRWQVELSGPERPGRPWTVEVVDRA